MVGIRILGLGLPKDAKDSIKNLLYKTFLKGQKWQKEIAYLKRDLMTP